MDPVSKALAGEQEEWISKRQASIISTIPEDKIVEAAAKGLLTVRKGVDDIGVQTRYSRASCEALAQRLIQPACPESLAGLAASS
jgi:hypothetical protein